VPATAALTDEYGLDRELPHDRATAHAVETLGEGQGAVSTSAAVSMQALVSRLPSCVDIREGLQVAASNAVSASTLGYVMNKVGRPMASSLRYRRQTCQENQGRARFRLVRWTILYAGHRRVAQ